MISIYGRCTQCAHECGYKMTSRFSKLVCSACDAIDTIVEVPEASEGDVISFDKEKENRAMDKKLEATLTTAQLLLNMRKSKKRLDAKQRQQRKRDNATVKRLHLSDKG